MTPTTTQILTLSRAHAGLCRYFAERLISRLAGRELRATVEPSGTGVLIVGYGLADWLWRVRLTEYRVEVERRGHRPRTGRTLEEAMG